MSTTAHAPTPATPSGDALVTHVIHMARATARRAIMDVECGRIGLVPVAWAACDGSAPDQAARLAALPDAGPWGPMDAHAKGCLLSHLDALDRFLASDASHALILEDDVHLSDDLTLWHNPGDWWPAGADLVKLERWRDDRLQVLLDKTGDTFAGRHLHRLRSRHSGTGGYIIARSGAAAILAHRPRDLPVDHLLFNMAISPLARRLTTYQINPALVIQGNDPAPVATPVTAVTPRRRKPVAHLIKRGLAELRALRDLPRLLTGRSSLRSIRWQNRAIPD